VCLKPPVPYLRARKLTQRYIMPDVPTAMFELFQVMHPEQAIDCCLTTFLSLRPWWIVAPTQRTLVLVLLVGPYD
jgi:hypothetical protein